MKLAIIVPCYNEEEVLPETTKRLLQVIDELVTDGGITTGKIMYVDDGSKDKTWELIESFAAKDKKIAGLKLAHNVGHQFALWAGLEWAATHSDAAITIDADLQDDVDVIKQMVDCYNRGNDIVFGARKDRKTDTAFKRISAQLFYRMMNGLGGNIIYNHADFRLMSRRTLQALMTFPERNLFLRGMVATLGFPQSIVYYDRKERFAGQSKYPIRKMLNFALDGITSFSIKPLRYIMLLGLIFILIAIIAIIYALVSYFKGMAIQGWTSLLISVWFIGGTILLACGVIGEYVGKIYIETKSRPRYFIEKETGNLD
ncbi:MAG: glycosyltransferase family 2 protein [Prevotella sp.]|nr:glycosyltransferase family 2 protein [Prevotella sp.]